MKKNVLVFLWILMSSYAQAVSLDYFIDPDTRLNPEIPSPESYFNQEFGKWHINHDQQIGYLKMLASLSDRIELEKYGSTHQNRDLIVLKISSPQNIQKLETIRNEHLLLSNPNSDVAISEQTPFVYWLGYSVHGDEQSAGNAAVLMAYYLAAAETEEVKAILQHSVILLDPCLNPDGFQRAALWSNMHRSHVPQPDLNNVQFKEMWPTGRYNHYWFDLNRDWLPLQQPESKARVEFYHKWKPNLLSDHHEMGTAGTFFFQPGEPSRNNHLTPQRNLELTRKVAQQTAQNLDADRSLYFTEERFDDFYYGKGSSYPDANGCIGVLFEMVKNRGEVMRNENGLIPFADGIKNHFTASLSILQAGIDNRNELLEYQQWFYDQSKAEASKDRVQGIVLAGLDSPVKMYKLLSNLKSHQIELYKTAHDVEVNGKRIPKGKGYVVPFKQAQYRLIKSIFEVNTTFKDSLFYDVSAWNLPLAFNIPFKELESEKEVHTMLGDKVETLVYPTGGVKAGEAVAGYVIPGSDNTIHQLIYELVNKDVRVRVASKPFSVKSGGEELSFSYGDVFIPGTYQKYSALELQQILDQAAQTTGLPVYPAETALTTSGVDLGSRSLLPVQKPKILMLVGRGMKSSPTGEVWHLLDYQNQIPVTRFESHYLSSINLFDYNTLILPDGSVSFSEKEMERIRSWVNEGGTLIAIKNANKGLEAGDLITLEMKKKQKDTGLSYAYADRTKVSGSDEVGGVIFKAAIDVTHPICYGYRNSELPLFKNSLLAPSNYQSAYNAPIKLVDNPLICGYVKDANEAFLAQTSQLAITKKGKGRIISFYFNPLFRSFWQGTDKLFLNAVFYGPLIK